MAAMNFPDLDRELNDDPLQQIAEIERKNREESAGSYFARDLVARVVANHRERQRLNACIGRASAPPRKPRRKELCPRKPRAKKPRPPEPERPAHWADFLLEYVRRDFEVGRRTDAD